MSAIKFQNVWEKYRIKFIKEGKVSWEEFCALEDVSFSVNKGEVLGVIGQNGAGKTTLLKLISGMLLPDKGKVDVSGKVSMLMELGAGFNPEFTGRENISLNARMYGLEEGALEAQMEKIIAFAGLGNFIDAPIKYYSQGMYMRLAFALAIFVEPDIFLIDDILAVGDEEAQPTCIKKIFDLKQEGKTIILVSHDMNMINKLCDRVVLIEKGRVIQEGVPGNVIPYYLETVGDKNGIGVLEKEGFRVVFNNGRVNLSCEGNFLTKGTGSYAAYFLPAINAWASSHNLSWRIRDISENRLVAEGGSNDGTVSQIMTLQFLDSELLWQVEIKEAAIKEPHINLFFSPQYKKWATLGEERDFPAYIHKSNWQDLGLSGLDSGILGVIPDSDSRNAPYVIFTTEENNTKLKLLNSGYEQEMRIIQAYSGGNNIISVKITVLSERKHFRKFIEDFSEILRIRQKQEQEKLLKQEEDERRRLCALRTITNGPLSLFVDMENKIIRLYYKDVEITQNKGLYTAMDIEGEKHWFHSYDAKWDIKKISKKELTLSLNHEDFSLTQIWSLCYKDDNTLEFKIDLESKKPLTFINQNIRLETTNKYENWSTVYEKGNLSANQYIADFSPVRLKNSRASKAILKSDKDYLPSLFFGLFHQPDKRILSIYKQRNGKEEYVCLSLSLIIPRKEQSVEPGVHTCFQGQIILDKETKLEEPNAYADFIEINGQDLRFIFDRGRGRIFIGKKEFTSGLGVYTSVRSSGVWYDSHQATWEVNKKENNKIILRGDWPYIPISQTWQIEMIEKNSISWRVDMEIYEGLSLEIEQANLMLSPKYKSWMIPGVNNGEFLDEFSQYYDFSPFRFWYGKADNIVALSDYFPKIIFKSEKKNDYLRAIVENTDELYQARRIQYQKLNIDKILPGKYLYFRGIIELET